MKKISYADLEWAFSELAEENERLREENGKLRKVADIGGWIRDQIGPPLEEIEGKPNENTGASVHTALVGSGPEPGEKSAV